MSVLFQKANLTDKSLNLTNFNRMVDYLGRLANMTSPNMMIDRNPNGYVLKVLPSTSTTTTMSYSDWAFGFSISGAVVTVKSGRVFQGVRTPVTAVQANITITADQTWIYVSYVFGGGAATITSNTTMPPTNATTLYYPLHLWGVSGGVVSLASILHLGDIVIPGVFA